MICADGKGGINMLDIESYFLSLKAPWLYCINNSYGPWILKLHCLKYIPEFN